MANKIKVQKVSLLKDSLKKAKSLTFVDYQGLTHKQLEELRKSLTDQGELQIAKNTLIKLALNKDLVLNGPTAMLLSLKDELSALQIISKFIKKYQLPKIKFGLFGDKIYSTDEVTRISQLPAKEILLSQMVAGIKAPLSGMVYVLKGNLQKLVLVLGEINNKRSN